MTRLVLVAAALLTGAATAPASIAPRPMNPYRDPPPYAGTQQVALLLPFASIAGEPAVLTVRSLQAITVSEPGSGGPCGNPDRFSAPPSGSAERASAAEPAAETDGASSWVPFVVGGGAVGGLAALGLWLVLRTRGG